MKQELDKSNFFPKVLQVVPTEKYSIYVYFNDGSVRLFNVKPLIKVGTVFEPLLDINFFKSKLSVINGTVSWDIGGNRDPRKCIDIDPFVIFNEPVIADPLCEELKVAEHGIPYSSTLFSVD